MKTSPPPSLHTQSLKGVCHGLIFSHVDESSAETEMREDEENFLQNPVHLVQMLERTAE